MGSACVFFDLLPNRAELSDFNEELVDFFVQLRDAPRALASDFSELDPDGSDYYALRSTLPKSLAPATRAARFLYLNRFAFNGVYRTNRQGQFNVPRGVRTGSLPTTAEILMASRALDNASVVRRDYLEATRGADANDFVYLDPPYRNTSRATYGEYGYGSFGSALDVSSLAKELRRLHENDVRVLLSFNDDEEILSAIPDWRVVHINRRRSVAAATTARTALKGEILAYNFKPGGADAQGSSNQ